MAPAERLRKEILAALLDTVLPVVLMQMAVAERERLVALMVVAQVAMDFITLSLLAGHLLVGLPEVEELTGA
jgi:hypothetical protein